MRQENLDSYASLYIDAINYREDAARNKIKLGENELEATGIMKRQLLDYVVKSLGVNTETHDVTIDPTKKKVVITDKPTEKEKGPDV